MLDFRQAIFYVIEPISFKTWFFAHFIAFLGFVVVLVVRDIEGLDNAWWVDVPKIPDDLKVQLTQEKLTYLKKKRILKCKS